MEKSNSTGKKTSSRRVSQIRTPEGQEQYMINISMKEAERKILNHEAPSQLLCFFLKLATMKEQLENDKLRSDLEVAKAKIKQLEDSSNLAKLQEEAIAAFKRYSGVEEDEVYEE